MFCPFKFANPGVDVTKDFCDPRMCQCEKETCMLWIARFAQCALAVDAYLKAQADWRAEKGTKE